MKQSQFCYVNVAFRYLEMAILVQILNNIHLNSPILDIYYLVNFLAISCYNEMI